MTCRVPLINVVAGSRINPFDVITGCSHLITTQKADFSERNSRWSELVGLCGYRFCPLEFLFKPKQIFLLDDFISLLGWPSRP